MLQCMNCLCRDIELLALFIACLCHDIDHRGTTNSFQVSSVSIYKKENVIVPFHEVPVMKQFSTIKTIFLQKSALASLYSSEGSVMEVS